MNDPTSVPGRTAPPAHVERAKALDHLKLVRHVCGYAMLALLSGCTMQLLNPKGDVGAQEKTLIVVASALMLLVVIPVIALTLYFAWRYRATNTTATYSPKWSHSTRIEVVVWTIPCVIVATLAILIWSTTRSLDPYKPIESALTADSILNAFFVPRLGSMVYAMPGMRTKLHRIANDTGAFNGMSAAYSGAGFPDMRFDTVAGSRAEFDAWVARARKAKDRLDVAGYGTLARDSNGYPVTLYRGVEPGLFQGIVNRYMQGSQPLHAREYEGRSLHHAAGAVLQLRPPAGHHVAGAAPGRQGNRARVRAAGLVLALFATLMCFALVWHMWAVAAAGLLGAIATFIVRSYDRDIDYTVPAAEVERIENARHALLAQSRTMKHLQEAA